MGCGSSSAAPKDDEKQMKGVGPSDEPSSARDTTKATKDSSSTPAKTTAAPQDDASSPAPAPFTSGFTFGDGTGDSSPPPQHQSPDDEDLLARSARANNAKQRRIGVSAEPILPDEAEKFTPPYIEKDAATVERLRAVVVHNPLFKALTKDELGTVLGAMKKDLFQKGQDILTQGEIGSERFYFIVHGTVDIVKKEVPTNGGVVCTFGDGQTFGEMELMYLAPCAATVRVSSADVETYSIDRDTYRHIVMMVSIRKRRLYKELLAKVSWLSHLSDYDSMMLADALERVTIPANETLIRFGDDGTWMYFIIAGTVKVVGRDTKTGANVDVCTFTVGDCVGDLEFLNAHRAVADVVSVTEVDVCRLHRDHFELCLGPLKEFLKGHAASDDKFEYYRHLDNKADADATGTGAGGDLFSFAFGDNTAGDTAAGSGAFQAFGGADGGAEPSNSAGPTPMKPKSRRVGVSDESQENDENWTPPVVPKSDADKALIRKVLKENIILSSLKGADRETLVDAMTSKKFPEGTNILTQGGDGGEYYFVIAKGMVDILKQEQFIVSFSEGQGFGEMELMYVQPCLATVRARTAVDTWAIDRKTYKRLVMSVALKRRELYTSLLKKVEFLALMTEYERLQLSDALETVTYEPGQYLIRRGETNDFMFLIISGNIAVYGVDDGDHHGSPATSASANAGMRHVTDLGPGTCVGELEFLNQHPAVADCMATVPTTACRLHRDHFELCMGPVTDVLRKTVRQEKYAYYNSQLEEIGLQRNQSVRDVASVRRGRGRAKAISAEVDVDLAEEAAWVAPSIAKSDADLATLSDVIQKAPILAALGDEQRAAVRNAMAPVSLSKGATIATEGKLNDDPAWYIIAEGTVHATRKDEKTGKESVISVHAPHTSFGELDILYATPSPVSLVVVSDHLRAFRLDRTSYKRLIMKLMMERRQLLKELLTGVPFLTNLTDAQQATIADALSEVTFAPGTALVQAGHQNEWMYIIADGIVEVFDKTGKEKICDLRRGEMVGELEFLHGHPCVASCVAKTHVHACRLHRDHFQLCMGPVQGFMEETLKHPKYAYYNATLKKPAAAAA